MLTHKTLSLSDCDIKMDGGEGRFSGYASVFGGVDSYGDTIVKGAYEYTLKKNGKPKMFLQHDSWSLPIGKWLVAKEDDHGLFVEGELTPGLSKAQDTYAALKHGTLDGLSIGYMLKAGDYEELADGTRLIKRVSALVEVSPVVFPADGAARIDLSGVKSMKDIEKGLKKLSDAIMLHEGHMDGSIPTSDESQAEMMKMMVDAYHLISGEKPMMNKSVAAIETIRDFERFLRDAGGLSKGLTEALVSRAKIVFGQGDPDPQPIEAKAMAELMERINRAASRIPQ